ncbi:MAG: hypothetical protein LBQ83_01750 [Candidatus Margulisbacteria bacterium]|jgi:hypothetical protein|nr:hypothetical protein [Candidatus Margulisiibacteriota bacterium]
MLGLGSIKKLLERLQRFLQLKEILSKAPGDPRPKSYQEMNPDEFYDFLLSGGSQEEYYDFLLNFLLTGYLDGSIDEQKFKYFLGLSNPLQINRYVDKLLREAKMQGSIYEEMLKYRNSADKQEDLLALLVPERAQDKNKRKITDVAELKELVKDNAEELQKQKQALAQARMLAAEKKRQEELRQAVILNAPEAGELLTRDTFETEEKQVEQTAGLLYKELTKQQKGTVLRQAVNPEKHSVISEDTSRMSPGELVAYKKKILSKMRRDMNAGNKMKI